MQVLVDTSVWSLVFRKKKLSEIEQIVSMELRRLIDTGAVEIIGAIRQEILSGITSDDIFLSLKIAMQKFKDLDLVSISRPFYNSDSNRVAIFVSVMNFGHGSGTFYYYQISNDKLILKRKQTVFKS
ncbi:MAG: hypothetical protein KIT33_08595 [Candidatus Kapabacteria bacterium]|nr:hypothetical protein [Ignavibacteriota bacterium]MCW5885014.1 hypothetical protein [Candidatus Kapabacteria bacterium]